MFNALTIDVEDYFMVSAFANTVKYEDWDRYECRVEMNTYRLLEVLGEYNVNATFFVLGWVGERYPKLVKDIHSSGHEVASHGYNHRLIYDLTPDEFREDVKRSKDILETITGAPVTGFRATSYSIVKKTLWALDILIEEGFIYDSSIFPINHDRYGYPEFDRFITIVKRKGVGDIIEVPPSTLRFFGKNLPIAGGGYLRFLPTWFIKRGIYSINEKEAQPAIIYAHPWEIDPEQPRLNGRRISSFRHYVNLDKTLLKVKQLLGTFKFGMIKEVVSFKIEGSF